MPAELAEDKRQRKREVEAELGELQAKAAELKAQTESTSASPPASPAVTPPTSPQRDGPPAGDAGQLLQQFEDAGMLGCEVGLIRAPCLSPAVSHCPHRRLMKDQRRPRQRGLVSVAGGEAAAKARREIHAEGRRLAGDQLRRVKQRQHHLHAELNQLKADVRFPCEPVQYERSSQTTTSGQTSKYNSAHLHFMAADAQRALSIS